jgi:predicted house-cleaning noncanonical NTP pyrophosphatase (MazG superfamily)
MAQQKTYKKLVRDHIPTIIRNEYKRTPHTRILSDEEYAVALLEKLHEEVQEYVHDKNTEELADILEVVYALARLHNTSPEQLEMIRKAKREKRGGFEEKIYLEFVEE